MPAPLQNWPLPKKEPCNKVNATYRYGNDRQEKCCSVGKILAPGLAFELA